MYLGIITKKFLQWKDEEPDYTWFWKEEKNLLFNRSVMKKIEGTDWLRVLEQSGEGRLLLLQLLFS